MLKTLDVPPVWTLLAALLAWLLGLWLPLARLPWVMVDWIGSVAMILGFALILWSALWFRRKKTTIHPKSKPSNLIVEGPYRFSRNPIYSGMALFLLGWVLVLGSVSSFLALPLFMWIITHRFILGEEAGLRKEFGAEAEEYLAKTRRW